MYIKTNVHIMPAAYRVQMSPGSGIMNAARCEIFKLYFRDPIVHYFILLNNVLITRYK